MTGLLLLATTALAAPLTQSAPDAGHQTWHAAVGAGALGVAGEPAPGGRVDLGIGVGDFGMRSTSTLWGSAQPDAFSSLALRYRFHLTDRLGLAPTLQVVEHASASPLDRQRLVRPGVALHRSGERVDIYLSVPLTTWVFQPSPEVDLAPRRAGVFENLLGMEAGASVRIGESVSLRGGLTGVMPSLGARYQRQRVYVDALGGTLGLAQLGMIQVGITGRDSGSRPSGSPARSR